MKLCRKKEPRAPGDFELLAQQLRGQRRREAEKVVAQRMKSSRAVAEARGVADGGFGRAGGGGGKLFLGWALNLKLKLQPCHPKPLITPQTLQSTSLCA